MYGTTVATAAAAAPPPPPQQQQPGADLATGRRSDPSDCCRATKDHTTIRILQNMVSGISHVYWALEPDGEILMFIYHVLYTMDHILYTIYSTPYTRKSTVGFVCLCCLLGPRRAQVLEKLIEPKLTGEEPMAPWHVVERPYKHRACRFGC